mmetsp:Transcript_71700/g.115758  ORF Transcript_71700/g.115758 Transcript_71700/m.115758 type:complete len:386 (-) Transcript_71700:30-1187(-)
MAADVAKFTNALDKVFKTFSSQEVQLDSKEMKGLGERGTVQYIEQKFQQHLQRARAAFLQEFRNHAVVVESEVRKIREELTARMEEKYGEKLASFRDKFQQSESLVQSLRAEIAQLKSLTAAQETYLTAARHRWGLDQQEQLRDQAQKLREDLELANSEIADLSHQLTCRDELVSQFGTELSGLEGELKRQAGTFAEEKRDLDDRVNGLQTEMQQMQKVFNDHLQTYEESFGSYRTKTTEELQIQDILNARLSEALGLMEEERKTHIKARTKPSARIGESQDDVDADGYPKELFQSYDMTKNARYRKDDMGMDTSWRDYQLSDLQLAPGSARKPPKFQVERIRRVVPSPATAGANAPDTPRSAGQMRQLPSVPATVGTTLGTAPR